MAKEQQKKFTPANEIKFLLNFDTSEERKDIEYIDHIELFCTNSYAMLDMFIEAPKLGSDGSTIERTLLRRIKLPMDLYRKFVDKSASILDSIDSQA